MSSSNSSSSPLRVFIFDSPRTNSQLFYRMWQQHPQLAPMKGFHPFAGAQMYGPERITLRTRHCEAAERGQIEWGTQYPDANWNTFETSAKALREQIAEAEQEGKIFFGKEHSLMLVNQDLILNTMRRGENEPSPAITTNPTYIPGDVLATLTPVFLFRHPALIAGSLYPKFNPISGVEPNDEDWELSSSLRWTVYVHQYFTSLGHKTAVIEAQDFVYNTEPTMNALCRRLGIDEDGWVEKWDPIPREHWPDHRNAVAMTGDLMGSSGLERRGKGPAEATLDLGVEFGKWKERFGDVVAEGLKKRVEAEMPVYEYLRSVKLTA
ncbi:uncharacterized protein LTR77_006204 [Saxophila tyrrhenica]|uniref:Uncharacterized protein n=1 Tax=Saxophila tyrrhenica TaxID=1690608 RepID=A0AAV9PBH7_9PEZI|nr:hypothetical protein LTR77_006204 [Saxophila tyrrhenica]